MPDFNLSRALDEDLFAYHVTLRQFLPALQREGLQPRPHAHSPGEPVIFVEQDQDEAEIYSEEGSVTLRFRVDGFGCTKDGECVIHDAVAPSDIEYFDGHWKSLLSD